MNYQSRSENNVSFCLEGLKEFKRFWNVSELQVYAKYLGNIKGFNVCIFQIQQNKNKDKPVMNICM